VADLAEDFRQAELEDGSTLALPECYTGGQPAARSVSMPSLLTEGGLGIVYAMHCGLERFEDSQPGWFGDAPRYDELTAHPVFKLLVALDRRSDFHAYIQYLSISFCSSPFALAFWATLFRMGDMSVNNPVILASAIPSRIAAFLMLLGLDLSSVNPSAANP